jgi:hypothetical protein
MGTLINLALICHFLYLFVIGGCDVYFLMCALYVVLYCCLLGNCIALVCSISPDYVNVSYFVGFSIFYGSVFDVLYSGSLVIGVYYDIDLCSRRFLFL